MVADCDLCETVPFKGTSSSPTITVTVIVSKGTKTSFIQPEISNLTVLLRDNQIERLVLDDIRTESTGQQSTDSQAESCRDNIGPTSIAENSVTKENNLLGTPELRVDN